MNRFSRIAATALVVSGFVGIAQPATVFAGPNSASTTNHGSVPNGKPFRYLNSRIDALQTQIDQLIGRVSSLEAWQESAAEALSVLQQDSAANAAAIALLQSEIANVNSILATKQDIIEGTCPDEEYAYEIAQSPASLVCRADLGAKGLAAFSVQLTASIPANSSQVVAALCPEGTVPTGGSYEAAPGLEITSSGIQGNGYSVAAANTTVAALDLNVTAACLGIAP